MPYGVYDLAANSGWVSVGVDHDTAAFAVNSIRQWWLTVGRARYPEATRLLITADGGGSNGSRVRLWKRELQKLANELGPRHRGQPPAARHQQVEQDRAPPLLLHQPELARQAARQLSRDHLADLGHTTKPVSPCVANSTPANTPAVLGYPMPRWLPSISNVPSSTANGTTPSRQTIIPQIAR